MPNLDQFFTRVYRCPPPPILCPFAMALSFMLRPAQSARLVSRVHTATVPQARLMQSPHTAQPLLPTEFIASLHRGRQVIFAVDLR